MDEYARSRPAWRPLWEPTTEIRPSVLAAGPRKLICVPGRAVVLLGSGEIVTVDPDAAAGSASAPAAIKAMVAGRLRILIKESPGAAVRSQAGGC
jgi:hypothetical protein